MSVDAKISVVPSDNNRTPWMEPEVRELSVRETQAMPHAGGDGNRVVPDCSTS